MRLFTYSWLLNVTVSNIHPLLLLKTTVVLHHCWNAGFWSCVCFSKYLIKPNLPLMLLHKLQILFESDYSDVQEMQEIWHFYTLKRKRIVCRFLLIKICFISPSQNMQFFSINISLFPHKWYSAKSLIAMFLLVKIYCWVYIVTNITAQMGKL